MVDCDSHDFRSMSRVPVKFHVDSPNAVASQVNLLYKPIYAVFEELLGDAFAIKQQNGCHHAGRCYN